MGKDIKRVAIVGSSGGNLYAQGGDDPYTMMDEMFAQGSGVDIEISFIQFIGASGSMDTISMDAKANLYFLEQGHLCESETKTLKEINQMAAQMDAKLASQIEQGQIDALILLSCDPKGVNHQALMMAAKKTNSGYGDRRYFYGQCPGFRLSGHQCQWDNWYNQSDPRH